MSWADAKPVQFMLGAVLAFGLLEWHRQRPWRLGWQKYGRVLAAAAFERERAARCAREAEAAARRRRGRR